MTPTTASAASCSPARKRPSPPAPTSRRCRARASPTCIRPDFFAGWEKVTATRKPWIAAVAGYALGGGCEVAMMADFIIAADTREIRPARDQARRHARHGRLAAPDPRRRQGQGDGDVPDRPDDGRRRSRALRPRRRGRARRRAARRGAEDRRGDRRRCRRSPRSRPRRWSTPPSRSGLGQGIRFERRLFHGLFGTEDQKEGMAAFVEKRPGNWKGR